MCRPKPLGNVNKRPVGGEGGSGSMTQAKQGGPFTRPPCALYKIFYMKSQSYCMYVLHGRCKYLKDLYLNVHILLGNFKGFVPFGTYFVKKFKLCVLEGENYVTF